MRLGIMQPYFFPYIGYFSIIKHVDKFILLDDVQFIRHGWIERNRILKQTGGWQYISVPLEKHEQKTIIKDIRVDNSKEWKKKILAQIEHYRKAPYYWTVRNMLLDIFSREYDDITSVDLACLQKVEEYLGFDTSIEVFSKMGIEIETVMAPDEWALNICKGIDGVSEYWNPPGGKNFFHQEKYKNSGIQLKFLQVEMTPYNQCRNGFEEGLSILDVMMFNSKENINIMLDRYKIYE